MPLLSIQVTWKRRQRKINDELSDSGNARYLLSEKHSTIKTVQDFLCEEHQSLVTALRAVGFIAQKALFEMTFIVCIWEPLPYTYLPQMSQSASHPPHPAITMFPTAYEEPHGNLSMVMSTANEKLHSKSLGNDHYKNDPYLPFLSVFDSF